MIPKYNLPALSKSLGGALRKRLGVVQSERLTSLETAAAFLRSRQMTALWSGTELPSLYEAITGELVPRVLLMSSPTLGSTWAWARQLAESNAFLLLALFRLRSTFVARSLWPAIAELSPLFSRPPSPTAGISTAARQVATFLLEHGPASTMELHQALPRKFPILPASLKKGLRELEEKLIVYPLHVGEPSDDRVGHTWELLAQRLKREGSQPARQPSAETAAQAVAILLEVALQAAHVVDTREAARWLPAWKPQVRAALTGFIQSGKLRTVVGQECPSLFVWSP